MAMWYLSRLITAALELPMPEPENVQSASALSVESHRTVFERFGCFGFQYYSEVFRPVGEEPEDAVTGDVAEDLADTYRDLWEGLNLYERGMFNDAAFLWRFNYGIHWGRHATSALRALHCFSVDAD